jgi:hypothetical protein
VKQEQILILCLRIVLIADLLSIVAFIVQYTRLAPWWRNQIGRTIVIKDILLLLLLMPSTLSLFFNFSRLSSNVAAWIDTGLFALMAPVMVWRTMVWQKISHDSEPPETS